MPWKETQAMDLRLKLVRLIRREGVSVAATAAAFGISRKTAYKWLSRFEDEGRRGLADRSRAPRTHPNRTPENVQQLVIEMRRRHPTWGPRKILDALVHRGHRRSDLPAVSTAGEVLKAADLVKPRRRQAPRHPPVGMSAAATSPNDLWTTDFKGDFLLGDGTRCYPLTIQDHHSKYVLQVRACLSTGSSRVRSAFRTVFQEYGVPRRILSDNGPPFAAPGLTGISRLAVDWMKQDIEVERTRPGHPEDNGSHERMHRDLRAETARPPCRTMRGQQHRFTRWSRCRNEERPHETLGGETPDAVYESATREYRPQPAAWEYPGHWEVIKVRANGMMMWRGEQAFISSSLRGEYVGLEEIDDGVWCLCYRRTQLGLLHEGTRGQVRVVVPNPWWVTRRRDDAGDAR